MSNETSKRQTTGVDYYGIIALIVEIIMLQVKFWFTVLISIVNSFRTLEKTSVRGRTVFITGTGHGIGKETALKYASEGAKVICCDINEKNNKETVQLIKSTGGQAFGYSCNVGNREEVNKLAAQVKEEHGFVHIVINNAGIMPCHPILETTEAEIRSMYDVNVMAHFWIIQAFLPDMIARNEGNIVALSSCAGLFGLRNLVPYCGTKFAVRGIMRSLTEELLYKNPTNNIKMTTIYPYMVDTGLCKNPRYRFPKLLKMVKPSEAAEYIINAQRCGEEEVSIPRMYLTLEKIGRIMPANAMRLVSDFLDTGLDADK